LFSPELKHIDHYTLSQSSNSDKSIKTYDKAIEINPNDSDAWSNKGAVLVYLESVAKKIGIRISLFCPKHGGICSFFLFDQRFII
jgi:hypothetical protein